MTSSRGDDPGLPADRVQEIFQMNAYQPHRCAFRGAGPASEAAESYWHPQDQEARRGFDEALRRLNEGAADEPATD